MTYLREVLGETYAQELIAEAYRDAKHLNGKMIGGEIVICKDFEGKFLERLVWDVTNRLVFIHTEDQFVAHESGKPYLEPVGFPIEDVFRKDETTGALIPYAA